MTNIKIFLKALQKSGYPNPTPDVPTIAKMVGYPVHFFLKDLIGNIGKKGAVDFIEKTFSKLGLMGEGMKIDLDDAVGEPGSYIYLIINYFDIVEDEEDEPVWIHYSWGESHLIHDGEVQTIDDIYDDVDLGTMGEYGDFMDEIQFICQKNIFQKTGFTIHFDSEI